MNIADVQILYFGIKKTRPTFTGTLVRDEDNTMKYDLKLKQNVIGKVDLCL